MNRPTCAPEWVGHNAKQTPLKSEMVTAQTDGSSASYYAQAEFERLQAL